MGNRVNSESWLGSAQLRYVEQCLWWNGMVSRREVVERFGCSGQQASAVLQRYLELNPRALSYSPQVRRYLAHPKMRCLYGEPSFSQELQKEDDLVGEVHYPLKAVSPKVHRYLTVAIRQQRAVTIEYQSRSDEQPRRRTIVPHAYGHDGGRYHVRAWCPRAERYADFSLLRVMTIDWPHPYEGAALPLDLEWENWCLITLRLNPAVSEGVRRSLMEDYDLASPEEPVVIRCRQAMRKYALYRLGFDEESGLPTAPFFTLVNESNGRIAPSPLE